MTTPGELQKLLSSLSDPEIAGRAETTRDIDEQQLIASHDSAIVHAALLRNPSLNPAIRRKLMESNILPAVEDRSIGLIVDQTRDRLDPQ